MSAIEEVRRKLQEQLDWRGPTGKMQRTLTLTRTEAESILEGPPTPTEIMDEIMRLAIRLKKEQVEAYAKERAGDQADPLVVPK